MKPTTKASAPEPTAPADEPGNTDIDGMSALDGMSDNAGVILTGRGVSRCHSALSGIRSITDILFQLELDKDSTGGIQASVRTTSGLIQALAVCAEFIKDHISDVNYTQHVAQAVDCNSPDYAVLLALHSRALRGGESC